MPCFKEVLDILYFFRCSSSLGDCSETLDIIITMVISFQIFFRNLIYLFLKKYSVKLGGPGVVVHFDDSIKTRRTEKVLRCKPSTTAWIFWGIYKFSRSCFLKFLPSRSRNDLLSFLTDFILAVFFYALIPFSSQYFFGVHTLYCEYCTQTSWS